MPEIQAQGASLVVVSPQLEKYSNQVVKKNSLTFPVLTDPGNKVAALFGLVFSLPHDLRQLYTKFGIDLERFNGNTDWSLALPGRFILNGQGNILSAEVDPDYTQRPDPGDIFDILKTL